MATECSTCGMADPAMNGHQPGCARARSNKQVRLNLQAAAMLAAQLSELLTQGAEDLGDLAADGGPLEPAPYQVVAARELRAAMETIRAYVDESQADTAKPLSTRLAEPALAEAARQLNGAAVSYRSGAAFVNLPEVLQRRDSFTDGCCCDRCSSVRHGVPKDTPGGSGWDTLTIPPQSGPGKMERAWTVHYPELHNRPKLRAEY